MKAAEISTRPYGAIINMRAETHFCVEERKLVPLSFRNCRV